MEKHNKRTQKAIREMEKLVQKAGAHYVREAKLQAKLKKAEERFSAVKKRIDTHIKVQENEKTNSLRLLQTLAKRYRKRLGDRKTKTITLPSGAKIKWYDVAREVKESNAKEAVEYILSNLPPKYRAELLQYGDPKLDKSGIKKHPRIARTIPGIVLGKKQKFAAQPLGAKHPIPIIIEFLPENSQLNPKAV